MEAVAGILHRMGSGGVVIEDPQAARTYINKNGWDPTIVSPDFLEHEFIVVKAYFPQEKEAISELEASLQRVEENFGVQCRMFISEVRDEDWEESWKKYYHTFKVGQRLVIKPSWEEYQPAEGEKIIEIDPGMAFGTGIHASTRFCLRFIDQYIKGQERVIDAGCGSGILSIAAAHLGAVRVLAMDIDDLAAGIARENVHLNGFDHIIEVQSGDIGEELASLAADVILANITAEVVVDLIPAAASALREGGWFLGSGIVEGRWPGVQKQLEKCGFRIEQVLTDVDWIGVAARRVIGT